MSFIISCEHAGNEVPGEFDSLFNDTKSVLTSHRGWDPGALGVAEFLAEHLQCSLHSFPITRLLIETNRSLNSPQLFSEFSSKLQAADKLALINELYHPYRDGVEDELKDLQKPVIHISVHSFTPVWEGITRDVDIGLLFDPSRKLESVFCEQWIRNLSNLLPGKKIKANEPYKGTDDGFTTYLRTVFSNSAYAGIEIEINQKYNDTNELAMIQNAILKSLLAVRIS
jgi:predicted N-formylglutamate amidohydrolase